MRSRVDVDQIRTLWNEHGNVDPMGCILTRADGQPWNADDFFRTGREEIHGVLALLGRKGIQVPRGRALDFGCGIGRLTQALAPEFQNVVGVDISPSMIRQAKGLNVCGDRCSFVLLEQQALSAFSARSFDFIYSNIALQHSPPEAVRGYLEGFGRLLTERGVLAFQLPSPSLFAVAVPDRLYLAVVRILYNTSIRGTYGMKCHDVATSLSRGGLRVVYRAFQTGPVAWGAPELSADSLPEIGGFPVRIGYWVSYFYVATHTSGP
jgi:SAM-dependent methyltransferase